MSSKASTKRPTTRKRTRKVVKKPIVRDRPKRYLITGPKKTSHKLNKKTENQKLIQQFEIILPDYRSKRRKPKQKNYPTYLQPFFSTIDTTNRSAVGLRPLNRVDNQLTNQINILSNKDLTATISKLDPKQMAIDLSKYKEAPPEVKPLIVKDEDIPRYEPKFQRVSKIKLVDILDMVRTDLDMPPLSQEERDSYLKSRLLTHVVKFNLVSEILTLLGLDPNDRMNRLNLLTDATKASKDSQPMRGQTENGMLSDLSAFVLPSGMEDSIDPNDIFEVDLETELQLLKDKKERDKLRDKLSVEGQQREKLRREGQYATNEFKSRIESKLAKLYDEYGKKPSAELEKKITELEDIIADSTNLSRGVISIKSEIDLLRERYQDAKSPEEKNAISDKVEKLESAISLRPQPSSNIRGRRADIRPRAIDMPAMIEELFPNEVGPHPIEQEARMFNAEEGNSPIPQEQIDLAVEEYENKHDNPPDGEEPQIEDLSPLIESTMDSEGLNREDATTLVEKWRDSGYRNQSGQGRMIYIPKTRVNRRALARLDDAGAQIGYGQNYAYLEATPSNLVRGWFARYSFKDMMKNGLSSADLDRMMESFRPMGYIGCFANDEENLVLKAFEGLDRFGYIMNTSDASDEGEHWICVFVDLLNSKSIELYDPLAEWFFDEDFIDTVSDILDERGYEYQPKLKYNTVRDQSYSSSTCGLYCVKFLTDRFMGKSFKESTEFNDSIPDNEEEMETLAEKFGYV